MTTRTSLTLALALAAFTPAAAVAQSSAEFDSVAGRYGQINTIAGSGARDNCNDWLSAMEGGIATAADLSRPHNAAADAAGNVYIADKEGFAVRKIDLEGRIHTVAGTGTFGVTVGSGPATEANLWAPNGIFVFPDGTFYFLTVNDDCVSAAAGGKVHRVTPDGNMTTVFEDPSLFLGRGLYVMPDQRTIYYCSGNVFKRWTESGGITPFATGFAGLGNIDREASGSFLVTDRTGRRVYRVLEDGTKSAVAGTGGTSGGGHGQLAINTGLDQVRGVAVVDTGGYFLCTHRGHQVWYVDTAGYNWEFVNPSGSKGHVGDGLAATHPSVEISEPRNITLAPNGDLLITEHDSGYIRRVTNITTEPRLVELRHDSASGFHLEWTSHREASYLVRRTTDLIEWTDSVPIPGGSGALTRYTDPLGDSDPSAFYQIVERDD